MNPLLPIDVDERTGVWTTDGLPMLYVPRHFFVNNHLAVEAALGRERYAEIIYDAGYRSAHFWCGKEAKTHGLEGLEVFEHYLARLSLRGWGVFDFASADVALGLADIRLRHSAFALAEPDATGKICYMFSGWFAGAMDWVTGGSGNEHRSVCSESQCCAEGHSHCVFAVRPAHSPRPVEDM
jgi:predicted hydrocarbon binding protein